MVDVKELYDKITVKTVTCQITEGWESSHVVAEHIVGTDLWRSLPEWDRVILKARVHKVIRENKLL